MKPIYAILVAAGFLALGCDRSPISPDRTTATNPSVSAAQGAMQGAASTMSPMAVLPAINPAGISCPGDAPLVRVGTFGTRVDIEFSEVFGATKYQIEIEKYIGDKTEVETLEVSAPAHRYEWYGERGYHYEVRVRTLNCNGFGNWSESAGCYIDLAAPTPMPEPPSTPACTLQPNFDVDALVDISPQPFGLQLAELKSTFHNAGNWRIEFVGHHNDFVAQNLRATAGQVVASEQVQLQCGQSQLVKLHQGRDSRPWWWHRIYRNGVLVSTSGLY